MLKQNNAILNFITNRKYLINILFAFAIIIIFPRCFSYQIADESVDSGWIWAIRYFVENKEHYSWGKDIIYTYGPLGIFSVRNFPSSLWYIQLLLDIYLICQLILIFKFIKNLNNTTITLLFIGCISTFLWEFNLISQFINLAYLFFILKDKSKSWLSLLIILNISLLTFIKLNTFFFSIFTIVSLIIILINNKKYQQLLVILLQCVALHLLFAYIFNVSFKSYIYTSFDTIKYYSYSMYFYSKAYTLTVIIGIAFLLFFGIASIINCINCIKKKDFSSALLIINIGLVVFFFFKQGFTRADRFHFTQYFCFLPILLLLLFILAQKWKKIIKLTLISSLLFSYFLTAVVLIKGYTFCTDCVYKIPILNYIDGIKRKIGEKENTENISINNNYPTIDFMYNNCYTKTKYPNYYWSNRPAFQSIVSVSSQLDSLNTLFYTGQKAPTLIIYKPDAVDDRNFLWDEPQTFLSLLKFYKLKNERFENQLIFERKAIPTKINSQLIIDTTINLNTKFYLPNTLNGIYFIRLNINDNIFGKVISTLFQPPVINVKMNLITNSSISYRYIMPLHNNQLLVINKNIDPKNLNDLQLFFNDINSVKSNVKSIEFSANLPNFFNSPLKLQLLKNTFE